MGGWSWRTVAGGLVVAALLGGPPAVALWLSPPRAPAELSFVSGAEPESLDPALVSGVLEVRLLAALFEGLVRIDAASLAPVPACASAIEVTEGARRFRFPLREGLAFSDGAPLTAETFVRSWQRAARPETGSPLRAEAARVAPFARAEPAGPGAPAGAVLVELDRPMPELPALLTLPCFLPVPLERIERYSERWTRPEHIASNGAFALAEHVPGAHLRFARNAHYGRPVGLASIEALTTSGASVGSDTAFLLYETGAADLVFSVPAIALEALANRGDLFAAPALATVFLRFNTTRPLLDDARVRRALTQAIDRERIVERVTRGGDAPTTALVPPGLAGYEPAAGLPFDLDAARAALAAWREEEGGAPERTLTILYAASDEMGGHVAEVLQAAWKEALGVSVELAPRERKAYFHAMRTLDYDIAWSNWVADYPDPANFVQIFRAASGNNRTGFADERFEALLDVADRAPDAAARGAALRAAEARLLAEAPLAPLFHPQHAFLCRPWVRGMPAGPSPTLDWSQLTREPRRGAP